MLKCRIYDKKPTIYHKQPVFDIIYELNYMQNI